MLSPDSKTISSDSVSYKVVESFQCAGGFVINMVERKTEPVKAPKKLRV